MRRPYAILALALSPLLMAEKCDFGTEPGEPKETYDFSVTLKNETFRMAEFSTAGSSSERIYHIEREGSGRIKLYDISEDETVSFRVRPLSSDFSHESGSVACRFTGQTNNLSVVYNGLYLDCRGNWTGRQGPYDGW